MNEKKPRASEDAMERELPERQLDPVIQGKLGAMLKRHFDDLVAAPIPDQFMVLLAELEAKEKAGER